MSDLVAKWGSLIHREAGFTPTIQTTFEELISFAIVRPLRVHLQEKLGPVGWVFTIQDDNDWAITGTRHGEEGESSQMLVIGVDGALKLFFIRYSDENTSTTATVPLLPAKMGARISFLIDQVFAKIPNVAKE